MSILIVNEKGLSGSGAEIRIRDTVNLLLKEKVFKEVYLVQYKHDSTNNPNIKVYDSSACAFEQLKKIMYKIRIIQIHNLGSIPFRIMPILRSFKKPIIFFAHDYWGFCGRRDLMRLNRKICFGFGFFKCWRCIGFLSVLHMFKIKRYLNKCDAAIAPSRFVKDIYEKNNILKGKWRIIKPWINLKPFKTNKKIKRDEKTILFVGPLSYAKGADLLISSLGNIRHDIPDVKLKVVGHGQEGGTPDRERIQKILEKDLTLENVEFCGSRYGKDLIKEYWKATVYVCPPIWPEVFGQTWAQAISCGCIVVATDVGSIPELASASGVIITKKEELAKILVQILKNKNASKKIYQQRNFQLQDPVLQLKQLYKELNEKTKL